MRRPLLLLLIALALASGDAAQREIYVLAAPALPAEATVGSGSLRGCAVLVIGRVNDAAEEASCRRDLAHALAALPRAWPGSHRVLTAGLDRLEPALGRLPPRVPLVLYLTGHGGGWNFGGLTRDRLAALLEPIERERILVVLDSCWSGEFALSFERAEFGSPVTLVTSADGSHMAPFPTTFLSPPSFGRAWFSSLARTGNPATAFREASGRFLAVLHPEPLRSPGTFRTWPATRG